MIKGYIDRIEEDKAVILLGDDYQKLNFPMEYLPKDLGEGDYIAIDIKRDEAAESDAADELLSLWQSTKGND